MLLLSPSSGGCHIHRTFRHNPQRPPMVCRPELIKFRPGDSMLQLLCLVCQILVADYFIALWPPTHCSSLFRQIHSEAPSVSRTIADKALFRDCPVIPSRLKVRHSDWAGNPLQPTSTGKHHAFQPLSTQLSVRAWYFVSFLSKLSSILSSHGTVSSTKATCLVEGDHNSNSNVADIRSFCFIEGAISSLQ